MIIFSRERIILFSWERTIFGGKEYFVSRETIFSFFWGEYLLFSKVIFFEGKIVFFSKEITLLFGGKEVFCFQEKEVFVFVGK